MRVLIVDDEKTVRLALSTALEALDYEVTTATNRASALDALRDEAAPIDVILLDLRLGAENGLDLLNEILGFLPRMRVIVLTAYASIDTAVEAMRRGAFDYLAKPCTPEQLRQSLEKVKRARRLERRAEERDSPHLVDLPELDLKVASTAGVMQEALNLAFKAASSDATVLLLGESGTGKSAFARAIHRHGPRAAGPFVTVSCQNDWQEILEMDLSAPWGSAAVAGGKPHGGKIAAAEGGTLFLDEMNDPPPEVQAKLLRFLQEREYKRVGEADPHQTSVRVVAATNQDLKKAVAAGKLRKDLFYHLSVVTITLPPLRARLGDVDGLVDAFLKFFALQENRPIKHLTPRAMRKLKRCEWPGNLRELRNVIERAVILSSGNEIDIADLPSAIRFASDGQTVRKLTLEEVQNEHIRHVLANTASLQEASAILGIDVATLYRKRRKLGV